MNKYTHYLNEGKETPSKDDLVSKIQTELNLDAKQYKWLLDKDVIMLPFKGTSYDSVIFTDGKSEAVFSVLDPISQVKKKGKISGSTTDKYNDSVNENLFEGLEPQSKKILKELNSYLIGEKVGSPELQFVFKEIFKSALTDVNDHSGSAKVDDIFPNAKLDTKFKTDSAKEYFLGRWDELGRSYAKIAKWDPYYLYQAFDEYAKKNLPKFDIMTILDESINESSFKLKRTRTTNLTEILKTVGLLTKDMGSLTVDTDISVMGSKVKLEYSNDLVAKVEKILKKVLKKHKNPKEEVTFIIGGLSGGSASDDFYIQMTTNSVSRTASKVL